MNHSAAIRPILSPSSRGSEIRGRQVSAFSHLTSGYGLLTRIRRRPTASKKCSSAPAELPGAMLRLTKLQFCVSRIARCLPKAGTPDIVSQKKPFIGIGNPWSNPVPEQSGVCDSWQSTGALSAACRTPSSGVQCPKGIERISHARLWTRSLHRSPLFHPA